MFKMRMNRVKIDSRVQPMYGNPFIKSDTDDCDIAIYSIIVAEVAKFPTLESLVLHPDRLVIRNLGKQTTRKYNAKSMTLDWVLTCIRKICTPVMAQTVTFTMSDAERELARLKAIALKHGAKCE